jgi:amidohydrolase
MNILLEQARSHEEEMITIRRDLHAHPEIAWEEFRTGKLAADYCEKLGLKVLRNVAKTGSVAILNAEKNGPTLALRADMDALPIQEENDVPYRSMHEGKGHLCGHDAHTAMLMLAAKILTVRKREIPFPVRFLFQPAEELPPGGAKVMIAEEQLRGVDEIFALHVNPMLPTGTVAARSGAMLASMDRVEIEVSGAGGHGAMPHLARDPIVCAAEIILALQSIVSRRVDPIEAAVLSICQINSGSAFNVIPSRASLIGTARSLTRQVREKLPEWIDEIASGVAKAHGQKTVVNFIHGTPVLINHAQQTEKIKAAMKKLGGASEEIKPMMGGEDFANYLEHVPGCFAFIGAGDGTPATAQCFHHPRYNIDEKALAWGSALFAQLVLDRAKV